MESATGSRPLSRLFLSSLLLAVAPNVATAATRNILNPHLRGSLHTKAADLPRALHEDGKSRNLSSRQIADSCNPENPPKWMENENPWLCMRWTNDKKNLDLYFHVPDNSTEVGLKQAKLDEKFSFEKKMGQKLRQKSVTSSSVCKVFPGGESCTEIPGETEGGDKLFRPRVFFSKAGTTLDGNANECVQGARVATIAYAVEDGHSGTKIAPRIKSPGPDKNLEQALKSLLEKGFIGAPYSAYADDQVISFVNSLAFIVRPYMGGKVFQFMDGEIDELAVPIVGDLGKCSHNSTATNNRTIAGLEIFGFVVAGAVVIRCGSKACAGGRSLPDYNEDSVVELDRMGSICTTEEMPQLSTEAPEVD